MSKVSTCIWYQDDPEEAANFYVSLLPDSRIDRVSRYPVDSPAKKAGEVMLIEFTLAGSAYQALNGGSYFRLSPAVSVSIDCEDQAEVDRLWDAILQNGGTPQQCGWIVDRWGLSWQIVPRVLAELSRTGEPAGAARMFQAMMGMVKLDAAALQRAYDGEAV